MGDVTLTVALIKGSRSYLPGQTDVRVDAEARAGCLQVFEQLVVLLCRRRVQAGASTRSLPLARLMVASPDASAHLLEPVLGVLCNCACVRYH